MFIRPWGRAVARRGMMGAKTGGSAVLVVALAMALVPTQLIVAAAAESPPPEPTEEPADAPAAESDATETSAAESPSVLDQPAAPATSASFDLSPSLASLPPLPRNQEAMDRNPVVDPAEAAKRWEQRGPEIVSERTLSSKVFEMPGDQRAAFIYGEPVHYADEQGNLQEIDNTIEADGQHFSNAAAAFDADFAERADSPQLVTITHGTRRVGFGLQGAAAVQPSAKDNTLTYPGVRADVDLVYKAHPRGVKELVVLHTPAAAADPTPYTFTLDPGGLQPVQTDQGGIALLDEAGDELFTIPPAVAWDSNDDVADPAQRLGRATLGLRQQDGQWLIDLSVDPAWATSPKRSFPLYIDPEIYISQYGKGAYTPTGMDAFVNQSSPNTNYPALVYGSYLINYVGVSDAYRTYTWFDVEPYHNQKIDLAEWWDYFAYSSTSTATYRLKPVLGADWEPGGTPPNWDDNTITHNSAPGLRPEQKTGSALHEGWGITDVEDWVRNHTSGSWGNHGLRVDSNGTGDMLITAQESTSFPAALRLIYRANNPPEPAQPISPAGAVDTLTPALTVETATDPDGDQVWYSYLVLNEQGEVIWKTNDWQTATSFTVPTGVLQWNNTYRWHAFTSDGDALGWPTEQTTYDLIPTQAPPNLPDRLSPADATRFTAAPTLQARYSSPHGYSGKLEFVVKDAAGSQIAAGSTALLASGSTGSFAPPALPDGTHYWQVRAVDDKGAVSAWTSAQQDIALAKVPAAGPGIGEQRFYGLDNTGLTDRMGISVNPANGNFMVQGSDLSIPGTAGMGLAVDRHYNSQSDAAFALGRGWTLGTGRDVGLLAGPDGSQQFEGPSGFRTMFTKNADGSYTSPTGLDATLTRNADGTHKLFFHLSSAVWNFTPGGYLSTQVDKNGNKITFSYTPESLLDTITDTQGRVTAFGYTDRLLTSMTDPSGRLYKYAYNARRLVTYTDPANKNTTYAYDGAGRMIQVTDPVGKQTKIAYDASGRATKVTRVTDEAAGTGPSTSYAYNSGNTVATDANSHNTTWYFDTLGRITKVLDHTGKEASATYTPNSNVATATDTMGATTTNTYDGKDNLLSAATPTGAASTYGYAHTAHPYFPSKGTNAQGNSLAYSYDAPGNMEMAQNDLTSNNQQKATYNPNGTVATTTDGMGNVTTYGYDAKGNLTTISAPLGVGSKTFTYDTLSRVKTVKDNKGQTTTVDHDALDRVTKLTFAGNATVVNTYDENGNLTKQDTNGGGLLEATVTTSYTYDKLNRQIAKTEAGVSFTSTYDGVGNLKSLTDPSGTTSYIYNSVNLLTELSEPAGAKTTFGYDDAYRRTRTTYPNGVVQNATYDSSGKVTSVIGKKADGTVLTSFTYDYVNPANSKDTTLLYKMTDAAAAVTTYGYDGLDRLIEANGPTGRFEYTYDGNGNRLTQKIDGQLTSYTSNEADQLKTAGSTTYSYDANGNRTGQSGGATLSYNSRDQRSVTSRRRSGRPWST